MKTLSCTVLLYLCGFVCLHTDEKVNDLDRMQGTWRVVSLTEKGKAVSKEDADTIEIVIDKDTFTASEKGVVGAKYQIKLDMTKTPKQVDFKHLIGESKGGVEPGIYRFEKDQIRMILDEDRKGRPTVFEGKETASYSVILLEKRPGKEKAKEKDEEKDSK
jgi:uncharacterized protein (TIGR03067 family)